MTFWERTWRERADAIKLAYGDSWPPESVTSFSWRDRIRCPGACALALPPIEGSRDPLRHRRDDWLYLTMGLSQPLDQGQLDAERKAGKSYSARGFELGFLTPDRCDWPSKALYVLLTHVTNGVDIKWGDRFAFNFTESPEGALSCFTGAPDEVGLAPFGNIRAVLFWRYLFPDWAFVTSTGRFMILIATGITEREWRLAQETTSFHLQLLLCRAGVGQRTLVDRRCLLDDPRWREEWDTIKDRDAEDCDRELEAGIG